MKFTQKHKNEFKFTHDKYKNECKFTSKNGRKFTQKTEKIL